AWTVGVLADWLFVVTGRVPAVAGDLALAVGVAGAILAAITGFTDHHDTSGFELRTATVHGLTMTAVLVIELVSLGLRLWTPGLLDGEVVTCPWHYSQFRFSDARVVGGPATFDQPLLTVRERGGVVEVKLAHPLQ